MKIKFFKVYLLILLNLCIVRYMPLHSQNVSETPYAYSGDSLKSIGMPCGGVAAGQLYVSGDGTFARWWISNNAYCTNSGQGGWKMDIGTPHGWIKHNYQTFEPEKFFKQGFAVKVKEETGVQNVYQLNKECFDNISFYGEYPVATIEYKQKKESLPVEITSKIYSPFIPTDEKNSSLPATIINITVKNSSDNTMEIEVLGWLQNIIFQDFKYLSTAGSRNKISNNEGSSSINFDTYRGVSTTGFPHNHPYWGDMTLSLLEEATIQTADIKSDINEFLLSKDKSQIEEARKPLGTDLIGGIGKSSILKPGQERTFVYVLSWFFPNRRLDMKNDNGWLDDDDGKAIPSNGPFVGSMYSNWFDNSQNVVNYIKDNYNYLSESTLDFHNAYYNETTLPYWLKQRCIMPVSNLASETCQWHKDGRFWCWEGVGSCPGNCTHVWGYDQTLVNFFPKLFSNVRTQQDFGSSLNDNGGVGTRGFTNSEIALDGHFSSILKAYRNYLQSVDDTFLKEYYPKIKQAALYSIQLDGNSDGIIEGNQHNTYDISFQGANGFISSYYLASMIAMQKMAEINEDLSFADSCETIIRRGRKNIVDKLWNGEYFIQDLPKGDNRNQYWDGCLSDQLLGQTWLSILNLGELFPEKYTKKTLSSIFKYNWKKDVESYYKDHTPERPFARNGESGLIMCTWPNSEHPKEKAVRYRNEIWTGIEHQVATNMIYYDMIPEALEIEYGIHQRYNGKTQNPWNEVEAGDHYARALASWGVYLAIEGFFFNGPEGIISFSPKLNKENHLSVFTVSEGWGKYSQKLEGKNQENKLSMQIGKCNLNTLQIDALSSKRIVEYECLVNDIPVKSLLKREKDKLYISFENLNLNKGDLLTSIIKYN